MVQEKLEQKLLQNGISTTKIHEKKIFPDYTQEIIEFNKDNKKKNKIVPFENQTKPFHQAVRYLNSGYPYIVFTGKPGIGKSLMLEYLVGVISQEIPLYKVKKLFPQLIPVFKEIIDKSETFEPRDYLFLPNLQNPNLVKPISYVDQDFSEDDFSLATEFCLEISSLFNSYADPAQKKIQQSLPKSYLDKYIKSMVYDLINSTYSTFLEMNKVIPDDDLNNIEPISIANIQFNEKLDVNYEILSKNFTKKDEVQFLDIELKKFAGFTTERNNITYGELESGISNTYLLLRTKSDIKYHIDKIKQLDVKDYNNKQIIDLFKKNLNEISSNLTSKIKKEYDNSKIKNQTELYNFVTKSNKKSYFYITSSNATIKEIYEGLDEIWSEYKTYEPSEEITKWMKNSISFFKKEKQLLKDLLTKELMEQEGQRYILHNNENVNSIDTKNSDEKKNKKDKSKTRKNKYNVPRFQFPHGDEFYNIDEIFEPFQLKGNNGEKSKFSWSTLNSLDSKTLFGKFLETNEVPPHQRFVYKGNLFKNSILVIPDQFNQFVSNLSNSEKDNTMTKDQFLEYLQTGILTLESQGVIYQLDAPKMILGCDNQNPFQTLKGLMLTTETGLQDRIKTINVPDVQQNSVEVREGTLRVLYNTIKNFNQVNSKRIRAKPDAINFLLQSGLEVPNYASLRYRRVISKIEDLCNFAYTNNSLTITTDVVKNWIKDKFDEEHFMLIDSEKEKYFESPKTKIGSTNGLFIGDSYFGYLDINSHLNYLLPNKKIKHFELMESTSNMSGKSMEKGFSYSIDYISNLMMETSTLPKLKDKEWQIKTHFKNIWGELDGASASMAIVASIISTMGKDPIYNNRFMTGTIGPKQGNCYEIGGVYLKSLVPYRLHELSEDKNSKFYYLFPEGNLREFSHNCNIDAFDINDKITSFPIKTMNQAYHLLTCGDTITQNDWENSEELGKTKIHNAVIKFTKDIEKI